VAVARGCAGMAGSDPRRDENQPMTLRSGGENAFARNIIFVPSPKT
jgi:hypothetical protein